MHRARTALILIFALLAAALLLPAGPASAASYGPGFDLGLGRIGAYVTPAGTQAYCLEIDKNRPLGATDGGTVGGWGGLDADALMRLNWVIHSYGQSADPVVTSAVNLYVWSVADPGTYGSHGMSGDQFYSGRAGAARTAVLGMLGEIRSAAAAVPAAGSVVVELDADLTGRVRVADPGARGGTLVVTGADLREPIAVTDGSLVEFTAEPEPGARVAVVSASATFAATSYPAAITVFGSGPDQHLGGPAGDPMTASDRAEVALEFHPVLESAVELPRIAVGDPAVDRLTVAVADGSPAPWRDGTQVHLRGTLYGPLSSAPSESAAAPEGAPVAWTEIVTADGPGEVASSGSFSPALPGHYTWVWTIAAADQPDGSLLPAEYAWNDRYGLAAESFEVVQPLPATGATGGATWWLAAAGSVLLGTALVLITVWLRLRLPIGAPVQSAASRSVERVMRKPSAPPRSEKPSRR